MTSLAASPKYLRGLAGFMEQGFWLRKGNEAARATGSGSTCHFFG
jgi:hypothetical protein